MIYNCNNNSDNNQNNNDGCCDVAVAQINYPSLKHTR
jgi:hypothetical protein